MLLRDPPPTAATPPTQGHALARGWLVRFRWATLVAQIGAVVFAVQALALPVNGLAVGLVVALSGLSNLALARSARPDALPAALLLDLALLTALLAASGGASNPFSALYLIHVAMAVVLLGPRWTWWIALTAALGFAALFPFTDPHAMHSGNLLAHLGGMWLAFSVVATGIAWFVARLARDVRERDEQLAVLQRQQERQQRVLGLATLAAGAAHELGSPLAAIAVSAREIALFAGDPNGEIAEEAAAIRAQVERCKAIVARLAGRAGASPGEGVGPLRLDALEGAMRARLRPAELGRLSLELPADVCVLAPLEPLAEALGSLVQNALLAGPGRVRVQARRAEDQVEIAVQDEGEGMSAAVLERLGEPFFSTRGTGEGMGLGVFLARELARSLGGSLRIRSTPGQGTEATLSLPRGGP